MTTQKVGPSGGANPQRLSPSELRYTLPSGDKIPSVALGTSGAHGDDITRAVLAALKAGYRHLDCAWRYQNEAEIGAAIKASGVPREEIWLTSKLWNYFHAPEDIEPVLDETLKNLQTSYVDLYLLHWPVAQERETGKLNWDLIENPLPTWKKLEELVDKGKIRNIGVSNFNIRRLTNLTSEDLKYRPAVNQVEINWFNPQPALVSWSKENGVLLEAYSPLGSLGVKQALEVQAVKGVAKQLGISPAQVMLSWLHQRGIVILPKSANTERIKENLEVSQLPRDVFDKIEKSATSHLQERVVDPSKQWGLDIFEDEQESS